jgi:hypothetical protein
MECWFRTIASWQVPRVPDRLSIDLEPQQPRSCCRIMEIGFDSGTSGFANSRTMPRIDKPAS